MIDKSKQPTALDRAKEIAKVYLNRKVQPVFNEKSEVIGQEPITSIYVTLQDHAAYINTDKEVIDTMAYDRGLTVVTVMEDGVVVGEGEPKKSKKAKAE
jgi:hypothetical protein